MTKELSLTILLVALAILLWLGWLGFEFFSGLSRPTFTGLSVEPLNPTLDTRVLDGSP